MNETNRDLRQQRDTIEHIHYSNMQVQSSLHKTQHIVDSMHRHEFNKRARLFIANVLLGLLLLALLLLKFEVV